MHQAEESRLMQDRACGARAKPMTATATSMVKAIWQSYFPSLAAEGGLAWAQHNTTLCHAHTSNTSRLELS